MPPRPVATPVIVPRRNGPPRPVTLPSSDSASERAMLTAAPSDAASPTKKALSGRPVRPAVAKIGANVETEPSINPGDPAESPAARRRDLPAFDFHESLRLVLAG